MRHQIIACAIMGLLANGTSADDRHFVLDGFERGTDAAYVELTGTIERPDLGVIIPATIQPDGSILLGDPPVDKIPSSAVQHAVCGQTIHFDALPERMLYCPPD
ncbi:MAG: hypothetical protein P8M73_00690 [Luminiphilus sp.]|nr:hypothetical protein [Luminiphilus sp.]